MPQWNFCDFGFIAYKYVWVVITIQLTYYIKEDRDKETGKKGKSL